MPAKWETLTDEDLYALSPAERQVIYKAAVDGWFNRPGVAAVSRVEDVTGLSIQVERELEHGYTYFEPFKASDRAGFQALAERLRALPRRPRSQQPRPTPARASEAGTTQESPLASWARRQVERRADTDQTEVVTAVRDSIVAMLREEIAYGADEATRPGLQRAIDMIEELP